VKQVPYVPDKSEPSALSRKPITGNVDVSDFSTPLEHSPQVFGRRPVSEVVDFQGHHTLDARRRSAVAHREYCVLRSLQPALFEHRNPL